MSADDNIKTITHVYEAFGRGDVATILDAVAGFFAAFGATMEVEEFTPVSMAANDTDVHSVVRFQARSRSTGRPAAMNLHHFFRFRDGKIAYYRGSEDTAQTAAVLAG